MISFIFPKNTKHYAKRAVTLDIGEIEDFDFSECADQIFKILEVLEFSDLIDNNKYSHPDDVIEVIQNLIDDIDLENNEFQVSERRNVRVEFRDELLSVEVFIGV